MTKSSTVGCDVFYYLCHDAKAACWVALSTIAMVHWERLLCTGFNIIKESCDLRDAQRPIPKYIYFTQVLSVYRS